MRELVIQKLMTYAGAAFWLRDLQSMSDVELLELYRETVVNEARLEALGPTY